MMFETEIPGEIFSGPVRHEVALDSVSPLAGIQRGIFNATLASGRHPDRVVMPHHEFFALVAHPEWMSLSREHVFMGSPHFLFGCQLIIERRRAARPVTP